MKCINVVWEKADDLIQVKNQLKGYNSENILIQVFCGISDMDQVEKLRCRLVSMFPTSAVIGASSAGEIIDGNVVENCIIISFTAFEHTRVKSVLIPQNDCLKTGGKEAAQALKDDAVKAVIVLGCGLKKKLLVNGLPFLNALRQHLGDVVIAGGLSSGYKEHESRVFVFTEQGMTEHGFAAAGLSGTGLRINTFKNLSWKPIGKKMTITHAQGKRLYTIDHKSVKDLYMYYLGIEATPSSLYLMNHIPLMHKKRGMQVTNPVLSLNPDHSFNVMEDFVIGEKVRFSYCDAIIQEEDARCLEKQLDQCNPEAVFVYSCESRKALFEDDIVADMIAFKNCPNYAGFFTFGECYTDSDMTPYFLQQTMTVLALSETGASRRVNKVHTALQPEKNTGDIRRYRLLKILGHLVGSTTRELEVKNRQLVKLANRDGLTGMFNRRYFDSTLTRRMKEHSRSGAPLSLILLDVDFFKQFNDHYGHVAGDDCLRAMSCLLQKQMQRPSDMAFRYGGEEFICILPSTAHPGALQKAEEIRAGVERLAIAHEKSKVAGVVTVSLGVITFTSNQGILAQELTDICDQKLYDAKHMGRNRVCGINLDSRAV